METKGCMLRKGKQRDSEAGTLKVVEEFVLWCLCRE